MVSPESPPPNSLRGVGLDTTVEQVYRVLIGSDPVDPEAIAHRVGLPMGQVRAVLRTLRDRGLVQVADGPEERYSPTPPDVALAPALLQHNEELELARAAISGLTEEYRASVRRRDAGQLVEVVTGVDGIREQLRILQRNAAREVLFLCKAGHVAMPSSTNDEEYLMLDRGVRFRVVYEQQMLEQPGVIDAVAMGIRHGEQARATDRLVTTGAPMSEHGLDEGDLHLLSLLVAGVTDKAIATQMGVSQRTVQRRLHDLMGRAGAETRMQLAWLVARRGWLAPTPM